MRQEYSCEELCRAIDSMKVILHNQIEKGKIRKSMSLAEHLDYLLDSITTEVSIAKQFYDDAISMDLAHEDQVQIITCSDPDDLTTFYFEIKPDELDKIYQKAVTDKKEIQNLERKITTEYWKFFADTKVYKWENNPNDDDLLKNILFGFGTFLIPMENKAIVQNFFIKEYQNGELFKLFLRGKPELTYVPRELKHPAENFSQELNIVIIEPSDFNADMETLLKIGAEKYLRQYQEGKDCKYFISERV